ncbi:MAG: hypothetical protein PHQ51_07475 [Synergistales bacterium]|nr:hypothetical protein [Synergistales bacterium]
MGEGIFARLPKRSPPARSEQSPAKKFSFPFRRKKKSRAKLKNAKKTFLRDSEPERAAAERSELVGILFKMSSDFFQQTPPKLISCLARGFAPLFGGHFGKIIPRIFEINRQFSRRKAAVHKLLSLCCGKAAMNRWFSFAFGEIQNEILRNCRCKSVAFL